MADKDIFRNALGNFTFDVASGGAIVHLADLGYTPQEIAERLDFPTPYEKVQEAYWKYCLDRRIIVEDRDDIYKKKQNVRYVAEYDSYGRKSFRRIIEEDAPKTLQTAKISGIQGGTVMSEADLNEPGSQPVKVSYVSCDFGIRSRRDAYAYKKFLAPLDEKQLLYIEGIPWPRKIVWHILDKRMKEILNLLAAKSGYEYEMV
jgi:hypothetical protein